MTLLIPFAGLEPAPWKNGGGSTTEIAIAPVGASLDKFDWRISLATIATDGPFSAFPGVDRTLALVDGAGAVLEIGNEGRFVLSEEDPIVEFEGESRVHATLTDGPTTDFNVMTARARCHHRLGRRVLEGASEFAPRGDITVLFLVEGEHLSVSSDAERLCMVRYDAVVFDSSALWTLEASEATVFVIDIFFNKA
ncbi:MAG: HutD family protein [Massilia sp.]